MNAHLIIWLFYAGLGLALGLFPAYIFFSATVSMAVMVYNKDVPRWIIRLSNGNWKARRWDITPFKTVPGQHRAEFIGATAWLVIAFLIFEYVIIVSFLSTRDVVDIVLKQLSFPVLLFITSLLPYRLTKRYVYSLGEYAGKHIKETRKNRGF
jgi:hypothetical protein